MKVVSICYLTVDFEHWLSTGLLISTTLNCDCKSLETEAQTQRPKLSRLKINLQLFFRDHCKPLADFFL